MSSNLKICSSLQAKQTKEKSFFEESHEDCLGVKLLKDKNQQQAMTANDKEQQENFVIINEKEYEQKTCALNPGQGQRPKKRPHLNITRLRQLKCLTK